MKVSGNSKTNTASAAAPGSSQAKPRKRFSEMLNDPSGKAAEPEDRGQQPLPMLRDPSADFAPVTRGQSVAARSDALLSSLVREITVQAPPGAAASVDIQFDSRTLEGLHVRVQKTNQGVEVRLSTSSQAVSRLLTANAQSLTEALAQRGYAAPVVSVLRTAEPAVQSAAASGRPSRESRDRGGSGQGGGQKRR